MKRSKAHKCETIAESVTECDQYVLDMGSATELEKYNDNAVSYR